MDGQWLDDDKEDLQDSILYEDSSPSPLDAYLVGVNYGNNSGGVSDYEPELDAITQLQSEHDAYVAILEATHKEEKQALLREIEDMKAVHASSSANQQLQHEVENSLAAIRSELESSVRAEVEVERQKEKEESERQFKEAMTKEIEVVSTAIREEITSQMQTQLQTMRAQVEAQVREELQTETERKVRLALVQQMRPQVRAELENALRVEIRTAYSQEIRKEVEAALIPELEKRIVNEYKVKHQRVQSAQKEQAEATLQSQLVVAKKELEDRMRRDAEAKVARKMAKQTESEVRTRVDKMRQEVRDECEAEARKHVEASLAQIKQERAEIARLRAVENVRRTREDAAHKDAEAEFHKKVAEFRRHVQEEEARIARMKAVVQWRDEHLRRPPSSISTVPTLNSTSPPVFIPAPALAHSPAPPPVLDPVSTRSPTPAPISSIPPPTQTSTPPPLPPASSQYNPTPTQNSSRHAVSSPPMPSVPIHNNNTMGSVTMPDITTIPQVRTATNVQSSNSISPSPASSKTNTNELHLQAPYGSKPPTGVAFDFTFDVKLIAAKLISDARDVVQPQTNLSEAPTTHMSPTSASVAPLQSTPTRPTNRKPSPSHSSSTPIITTTSLGHIATEQHAQREFERQPFIPPQGALGARLRVLLPRLYQLWDESEISHVYRLDFCSTISSLDISSAERRVAMEISRLRKVFPSIQKEMALVTRREGIKAQLAREDSILGGEGGRKERGLGAAEKGQLQAELRRITTAVHAAIVAWEATHNTPFMYRGFPYHALLS